MKRIPAIAALLALSAFADELPPRQRYLMVDDAGTLNSTNAVASQADLARVSASNQVAQAELQASKAGYNQANTLLGVVASNIAAQAVHGFYGVELSSFDAAVVFDEATARLVIIGWEDLNETDVVKGVPVAKWRIRFAFNQDLQTVQPYIGYNQVMGGVARAEWDNLGPEFVSVPVREEGTWTAGDGTPCNYIYRVDAWVPSEPSGFAFVRVPNDAALADGGKLDLPNGVRNGRSVTITWGGNVMTWQGGLLVEVER